VKLAQAATAPSATAAPVKKELAPQISPLEKRLQDMGSIRDDGSDKFFGMENVSLPRNRRARPTVDTSAL
jgi:hypothetical protein